MPGNPRLLPIAVAAWTVFVLFWPLRHDASGAESELRSRPHHRRPVALALTADGQLLFTANRRSGSVSVVDTVARRVVHEVAVGSRLSDLILLPGQRRLLVLDEQSGELLVLERRQRSLFPVSRLNVGSSPVSVSVSSDGRRVHVACLWARQLSVVDLSDPTRPRLEKQIDLPFCPRAQRLLADGETLVVASAFGGSLAFVDVVEGRLVARRELEGHNVRAMWLSPDGQTLLVPHQSLDPWRATTRFGVHWGEVLLNVVRTISVRSLLDEPSSSSAAGTVFYLGNPDDAAGDPTGIVVTTNGRQIVSLAGVSEIAISDSDVNRFARTKVGRRPTAMVLSPDQQHVLVANTFSDSVSMVDVESSQPVADISLGPQASWSLADRGERLFYDSRLSSDGWYSCHSCHTDGHSSGLLNDNLSDESTGAPKRVLSLLGVADTSPWAWNGRTSLLQQQIRKSIEVTMQGPAPTSEQVRLIEAYLQTLRPAPSLAHARGRFDMAAAERGRLVFEQQGCVECHEPPNFTSSDTYDVGLVDEAGGSHFNPPSLRGVSQRDRLFHDGRAAGLREVLTQHEHGLTDDLTPDGMTDLLGFLEGL